MDLLLADSHGSFEAAASGELFQALGQLGDGQRAYVDAVEPAQLDLVEARGIAADAREREALDQLVRREHGRVVACAPAEQGEIVAHGLGEVARVAQLLDGGCAVALGELLAVGAMQQRQVRIRRERRVASDPRCARGLQHEQLLGGVREMVLAADHVRDRSVEVVDRDGEVVEHGSVGACDHGVVHVDVLEARVASDHVVHDRGALVGDAQTHRPVRLGLPAKAPLGAVGELVRLDLLAGGVRAIGEATLQQRGERLGVALGAVRLHDRPLVPVEPEPIQRVEDLRDVLLRRALAVGVLDAQHHRAALVPRRQPVEQGGARAADVQRARGRWCEANPHNPPAC